MIVGDNMRREPVIVKETDRLTLAYGLMKQHRIRHLPVVRGRLKRLVGIITERDIRQAMVPMSVQEKTRDSYYLPTDILVRDFMTREVISVDPCTPIEEAARLIYCHKIGCLPVVEEGRVIGIITETDILAVFIEMMGLLIASSRIDVMVRDGQDNLDELCGIIKANQGKIISIGLIPQREGRKEKIYFFRLEQCDLKPIIEAFNRSGYQILSHT